MMEQRSVLPGRLRHLTRRFVGSLRPGGPSSTEEAWATGYLLVSEADLWRSMSGVDRRHAVAVARRVDRALESPERPVLAAALLHDVGKVCSGLGTPGRVVATVVGTVASDRAARWATSDGLRGRIGRYLRHPEEGAALLEAAGSDPLTVTWATEHHRDPGRWTVDNRLAEVLRAADDD